DRPYWLVRSTAPRPARYGRAARAWRGRDLGEPASFLILRKDRLPVVLHGDDDPAFRPGGIQRLVEPADVAVAVVGELALGVVVVHDQPQASAIGARGPLQHLQIAVGVAEGRDRPAADELVDRDRLAGAVVEKIHLRSAHQDRRTVLQ